MEHLQLREIARLFHLYHLYHHLQELSREHAIRRHMGASGAASVAYFPWSISPANSFLFRWNRRNRWNKSVVSRGCKCSTCRPPRWNINQVEQERRVGAGRPLAANGDETLGNKLMQAREGRGTARDGAGRRPANRGPRRAATGRDGPPTRRPPLAVTPTSSLGCPCDAASITPTSSRRPSRRPSRRLKTHPRRRQGVLARRQADRLARVTLPDRRAPRLPALPVEVRSASDGKSGKNHWHAAWDHGRRCRGLPAGRE